MSTQFSSNSLFFQWINNSLRQSAISGAQLAAQAGRQIKQDRAEFKRRKPLYRLLSAPEEQLKDFGVTRQDLHIALELPLAINAGRWLEDRRSQRSLTSPR